MSEKDEKKVDLESCLYDKTMKCPVCGTTFKTRSIRKGKTRFKGCDIDLCSHYDPVNPEYYDVIACNVCGYAAVSSRFSRIGDKQARAIIENISQKFIPKEYPYVFDVDTAIERYKLALLNAAVKKAKAGEKAYICLKLGWLYREKEDSENEAKYLKSAIEGFNIAFTNENFPICGIDEVTLLYIMAALNYKLGDIDESKKILGRLVVKKNIPEMIKQSAEDLRENIKKSQQG